MNLRFKVLQRYGKSVLALLDEYAQIQQDEISDSQIGRTDRIELHRDQELHLKERLIALSGPVATQRIGVASNMDHTKLLALIRDFHDVDDALEKYFSEVDGVLLDSESSQMFVHAAPSAVPGVLAALKERYPSIQWCDRLERLDLSAVTVITTWHRAKEWLAMKHAGAAA